MTLKLRASGLTSPGFKNQAHWIVSSAGWQIGSIREDRNGTADQRWRWSLFGVVGGPREIKRLGRSATFEEAREQFTHHWATWLAWAGLKEVSQ
jgi:hypothetical protein